MAENVSIGQVLLEATTGLAVQSLGKSLVPSMTCLRIIGIRDERLEPGAVVVLGPPPLPSFHHRDRFSVLSPATTALKQASHVLLQALLRYLRPFPPPTHT